MVKIEKDSVRFDEWDMSFAAKFGMIEAAEIVLDFRSRNPLPFIFDTYQLAAFLNTGRKRLFELVKRSDSMYRTANIPKKTGGTRELSVPCSELKLVQYAILFRILYKLPVSPYATAYHPGARLIENAAPHVGKKYLLKLDLSDFFDSIRFDRVYSSVFNTRNFPKQIGVMLTALCCRDDVLPQGAPTSPALSNLVMKNFDDNFGAWCKKRGLSYTRYCDDITVTGDVPLYPAYKKASQWLGDMGFTVNERKTRFITNASRQSVTGITVNEKLSVSSDYKRRLRQEVYYALKFGVKSAVLHEDLTDFICDGKPDAVRYYRYLLGKINFVLSVEPDNAYFNSARDELADQLYDLEYMI